MPASPTAPAARDTRRGPSMRLRLRPLQGIASFHFVVHELYASVQGEGTRTGLPCTFVRLVGCNLRCTYCDTPHAFAGGQRITGDALLAQIARFAPRMVLLTGGEPLLHPGAPALLSRLCDAGYDVLLETSGSLSTAHVDPRVVIILDVKLPSSGEEPANDWSNLPRLRAHDEVKFVIGSQADYDYAKRITQKHELAARCHVLFGCVFGALAPKTLCEWILRDALPVRLQLQMHKYIWDPKQQGV